MSVKASAYHFSGKYLWITAFKAKPARFNDDCSGLMRFVIQMQICCQFIAYGMHLIFGLDAVLPHSAEKKMGKHLKFPFLHIHRSSPLHSIQYPQFIFPPSPPSFLLPLQLTFLSSRGLVLFSPTFFPFPSALVWQLSPSSYSRL